MTTPLEQRLDLLASADSAFTITPHATNALTAETRAIWVGTGGNVTLRLVNDSADVLLKNLPSGYMLPVRATHVRVSGTTATDLVGLA